MAADPNEVMVNVVGVFEQQPNPSHQQPRSHVLILRDPINRELHVPIGSCEGLAIDVVLEQHLVARPLTHDLALRVLEKLSAKLERVVIDDVAGDASAATLHLTSSEGEITIAARPGDAVALAVRAEAPIYATEDVLARAGQPDEGT